MKQNFFIKNYSKMEFLALGAVAVFCFFLFYLIYKIITAQDEKWEREFKQNNPLQTKESEALAALNKTEKKQLEAYIKRIKKE